MADEKIKYGVELDASKYKQEADSVKKKTDEMGNSAENTGKKTKKSFTGSMLAAKLYAKAIGFVTSQAVKMAKGHLELEKSLAKANTLVNLSGQELIKYGREIEDIGIATSRTALEISDAWYDALSAGVDLSESMEFMETSSKLATAGFTSVGGAVDILTTAINAYGLESTDATEVAEIFLATQNKGKTTIDEMAQSFSNIAPIAAALGVSLEEVAASMATMTANGVPTAQTTTQLRALFSELAKEGSAADKMFQEMSGKTFPQFIKEGGSLEEALLLMGDAAEKDNKELIQMFGSIEAGQAAMLLGKNGAEGYKDALDEISNSAGILDTANDQMTQNLGSALTSLTGSFGALFNTILQGNGYVTAGVKLLGSGVNSMTERFRESNDITTRAIEIQKELNVTRNEAMTLSRKEDHITKAAIARQEERTQKLKEYRESLGEPLIKGGDKPDFTAEGIEKARLEKEKEDEKDRLKLIADKKEADELAIKDEMDRLKKNAEALKVHNEELKIIQIEYDTWLLEEKEKGKLTEEEFFEADYDNKQMQLEKEIKFYEDKQEHLTDFLQSEYDLKKMNADKSDELTQKELESIKDAEEAKQGIMQLSERSLTSAYQAMVNGRIGSLGDLVNVMASEVGAYAAAESAKNLIQGFSNLALGFAYKASSIPAVSKTKSKEAFDASTASFMAAAQMGVIAGIAGAVTSGTGGMGGTADGGGEAGVDSPPPIDEDTGIDDVIEGYGATGKEVALDVSGNALARGMLYDLNEASYDLNNIRFVGKMKR